MINYKKALVTIGDMTFKNKVSIAFYSFFTILLLFLAHKADLPDWTFALVGAFLLWLTIVLPNAVLNQINLYLDALDAEERAKRLQQ